MSKHFRIKTSVIQNEPLEGGSVKEQIAVEALKPIAKYLGEKAPGVVEKIGSKIGKALGKIFGWGKDGRMITELRPGDRSMPFQPTLCKQGLRGQGLKQYGEGLRQYGGEFYLEKPWKYVKQLNERRLQKLVRHNESPEKLTRKLVKMIQKDLKKKE